MAGACLALLIGGPAAAEGWAGFYTPVAQAAADPASPDRPDVDAAAVAAARARALSVPLSVAFPALASSRSSAQSPARPPALRPPSATAALLTGGDACLQAILGAQVRYGIPGNLLLAVGLQEAGMKRAGQLTVWPWTVNAAGDGRMFESADKAKDWVHQRQAAGVASIDVGCMQVNLRWHPDAFADLDAAFDPVTNVDYAARFLRDLYDRTGNWLKAAGSYHSFNDEARNRYLAGLTRNLEVANARAPDFTRRLGLPQVVQASATPSAPAPSAPDTSPRPARAPAPKTPQPGIGWWAALSDGADAPRVSIYSAQALEPVLPAFTQEF